ncbi:MAG: homoserine O-acetyltransferase [Armatimonadota bacterium]
MTLPALRVAYRSWGIYDGANAVLVLHALSGDADCLAWWPSLIGSGRPIDPDRNFILCANALGGCQGTTGPDDDPSEFPTITVGDMAAVQARLLDHLKVARLQLAIGGSMGGMVALALAEDLQERLENAFVTASAARHGAFQIAFNEVGRQAILRDPKWRNGLYPPDDPPNDGLAVARMLGHCTFLSDAAFEAKFGRSRQADTDEFAVESYLRYQGEKFTRRFSARSLVTLTRAIDAFDWHPARIAARVVAVGYDSDWLYPFAQAEEIVRLARGAGAEASAHLLSLPYGHDAFLLDGDLQAALLRDLIS